MQIYHFLYLATVSTRLLEALRCYTDVIGKLIFELIYKKVLVRKKCLEVDVNRVDGIHTNIERLFMAYTDLFIVMLW